MTKVVADETYTVFACSCSPLYDPFNKTLTVVGRKAALDTATRLIGGRLHNKHEASQFLEGVTHEVTLYSTHDEGGDRGDAHAAKIERAK